MKKILILFTVVVFGCGQKQKSSIEIIDTSISFEKDTILNESSGINVGKILVDNHCKACHSINNIVVGPELKDIKLKHSFDWTYNFLTNRKTLKKDTSFIRLESNNKDHCYEFPEMTKKELQSIIEYVESTKKY